MLWTNLAQGQMPNGRVDSPEQLDVSVDSGGTNAGSLFQIENILSIVAELLCLVNHVAIFDLFFKFVCGGSGFLQHLPLGHIMAGRCPDASSANLIAFEINTVGYDNSVARYFAASIPAGFNIWHFLRSFQMILML